MEGRKQDVYGRMSYINKTFYGRELLSDLKTDKKCKRVTYRDLVEDIRKFFGEGSPPETKGQILRYLRLFRYNVLIKNILDDLDYKTPVSLRYNFNEMETIEEEK